MASIVTSLFGSNSREPADATTTDDVTDVPTTAEESDSDGEQQQEQQQEENDDTSAVSEAKKFKYSPEGGNVVYGVKRLIEILHKCSGEALESLAERKYTPNAANGAAKAMEKACEELGKKLKEVVNALEFVRPIFHDTPVDIEEQEKLDKLNKRVEEENERQSCGGRDNNMMRLALMRMLMGAGGN